MSEKILQQRIRLYLSTLGYIPLRLNVGLFYTKKGVPVNTGLPKGTSDLLAISPSGQAVFIECKKKPNKPTKQQLKFIEIMKKQGAKAGVAYSVEDVDSIIK